MLNAYPMGQTPPPPGPEVFEGKTWIDLIDPTPEEVRAVEQAFSLHVPTRDELSEIETTSRLRKSGDSLCMSAPLIRRNEDGSLSPSPTGFILNRHVCLTVRFGRIGALDDVVEDHKGSETIEPAEIFALVLEKAVDRAADHLEHSAEVLDDASQVIFMDKAPKSKLTRDTGLLRQSMTRIGRASERMSKVRYTLVCVSRMAQYAADRGHDWIKPKVLERLAWVRADIASLEQYEENLLSRIQLLQDAATAFISIEQNDVVKVLTIASVVGIPPVLVVGVYGMNFKVMPELNWAYGYPYALGLMVVSMLVPLIWFKLKDWM